jgi:ankyrin
MYETALLHSASYQGTSEMVGTLLNHGVKLNTKNHWGETVLHVVSRGRQVSQDGARVAKLLLDCGANVNTRCNDHKTPLHLASYLGKIEIIRLLLDRGADLEAAGGDMGEKPLYQVSRGKYRSQEDGVRAARLLLNCGANVNSRRNDHQTPLHVASYFGNTEIVRLLLDHGADLEAATGNTGEKPLHKVSYGKYRSQEGGVRVTHLLLDLGADVNTRRNDHQTPLHLASYYGNVEIVRLLLDHGADLEAATGNTGEKPLHKVSYGKYRFQEDGVHATQLLLDRGADVNIQRNDHQTPLHLASYFGNVEIVRLLLNHGADLEAIAAGEGGEKPLHQVSYGECRSQEDGIRVTQLLLDHGADVNTRRSDHQTPLHLASYFGNVEIVRLLLDHGADLEAVWGNMGDKPLHQVSYGKYRSQEDGIRVTQLLLDRGADVNTQRNDHQTPLHLSSYYGNVEIVHLLLDHGADLEAIAAGEGGEKPLHQVSYGEYRSQEDGVRVTHLLLDHGADVNTRREDHQTPLHLASYFGNVEIVRLLLDHGADMEANAEGDMGEKPLHQVSYGKYRSQEDGIRVTQLLLDCGADVNTRRNDHQTPLHLASYYGNVEIVRLLLDHGADLEENSESDMGEKPLHKVSYGKYRSQEDGVRVTQLLLDHGADVNTRRKDHLTPLHLASYFGNVEIVRLLLDHGADAEAISVGEGGEKPLHQVAYGKYRSKEDGATVTQLLLDHCVDVNTRRKDHQTPLHLASYLGNIDIVRLLLDHGADLEAAWGNMGMKPLHQVSYGEYRSHEDGVCVTQLLLDRGADVNTRRKDHKTPLHLASYYGSAEIVRLLLDHGADLEAAWGNMGMKPLHQVSYGKYRSQEDGVRVTQLLLDRGADVNTRRNDHQTPLHVASYHGSLEILQILIDHGAEVNAVDKFGKSPLHEVSQGEYEVQEDGVRVARLLLDRGADVNAKAKSGDTPLHLASVNKRPKLAELFLEHAANVNAVQHPIKVGP